MEVNIKMFNDLISREYVLTEYDHQHKGPPGGARKIMEEAPTIDAIPVEWIVKQTAVAKALGDMSCYYAFRRLVGVWQKEQEAQK